MNHTEKQRIAAELIQLVPLLHKVVFRCRTEEAVPPKQMQVLMELAFADTQSMTQLTERTYVSKQQLTQLVDALVEKGLVAREGSAENRRLVLIRLTDGGRQLLDEMVKQKSEELEAMLADFSEEERDTVARSVRLMRHALHKRIENAGKDATLQE